jgi:O-antigen/teichoic acid export membrane protein
VLALQILSWSAVLVILRGTFRQAFNAAGRQRLDFACAATSVGANLALNALLIPRYGIPGAATATLVSEGIWFGSAVRFFSSRLARIGMTVSGKRGTSTARCPGWVGWGAWLVQGFRDEHRGRVERSAPRSSNASAKRA